MNIVYVSKLLDIFSCNPSSAKPRSQEEIKPEIVITRATGRYNFDLEPGAYVRSSTRFQLEAGEKVTINATFSPPSADVSFGLVGPDNIFRYLNGENGNCEAVITVSERGYYTFAVRNNSSVTVAVSGFITY